MRDPERIERILVLLANYWKCVPDMRLGQIFINIDTMSSVPDLFFLEDDQLEIILQTLYERQLIAKQKNKSEK